MPGEPGFDELPEDGADAEALAAAARRAKESGNRIAELE